MILWVKKLEEELRVAKSQHEKLRKKKMYFEKVVTDLEDEVKKVKDISRDVVKDCNELCEKNAEWEQQVVDFQSEKNLLLVQRDQMAKEEKTALLERVEPILTRTSE